MPFVISSDDVQLAVPGGTATMSPSRAEAMAEPTSASETLLALTVPALTEPQAVQSALAMSAAQRPLDINLIAFGAALSLPREPCSRKCSEIFQ